MNTEPERVEGHELPVADLLAESFASPRTASAVIDADEEVLAGKAEFEKQQREEAEDDERIREIDALGRGVENLEHLSDRVKAPDYSKRIDLSKLAAAPAAADYGGGFVLPEINPGFADEPREATSLREEFAKLGAAITEELVKQLTQGASRVLAKNSEVVVDEPCACKMGIRCGENTARTERSKSGWITEYDSSGQVLRAYDSRA